MAKAPVLGRVKLRLAATVGAQRALEVYRALLRVTARAAAAWPGPVAIATAGDERAFAGSGLERFDSTPQPDGELGTRIAAAVRIGLSRAPAAIVVGSDCPGLQPHVLCAVGELLATVEVGFGPAGDGGFWALATASAATARLLERTSTPWSSPATLAMLRQEFAAAGVTTALGPMLDDCDTAADLERAIALGLLPAQPTLT